MSPATFTMVAAWFIPLAALLLIFGAWALAPLWESRCANRFKRESGPLAAAEVAWWKTYHATGKPPAEPEPAPRVGLVERVARVPYWLAVKVLRLDRTGAAK